MGALPVIKLTVEEYLAAEEVAEFPSEYHDGEVFPLEAASLRHGTILLKLGACFLQRLRSSPCQPYTTVRVRVSPTRFLYPDIVLICGEPERTKENQDTVTNPKVIVEILSPSTSNYDFSEKFHQYRRLESFEEYLLVAQDEPRVEVFRRMTDGRWILSTYEGIDAVAPIESLSISVPLAEIYEVVE
jgi:Uma2 family endonuclease